MLSSGTAQGQISGRLDVGCRVGQWFISPTMLLNFRMSFAHIIDTWLTLSLKINLKMFVQNSINHILHMITIKPSLWQRSNSIHWGGHGVESLVNKSLRCFFLFFFVKITYNNLVSSEHTHAYSHSGYKSLWEQKNSVQIKKYIAYTSLYSDTTRDQYWILKSLNTKNSDSKKYWCMYQIHTYLYVNM